MTLLLVILFGIHAIRALLPLSLNQEIIWTFGFVPARYETTLIAEQIPGGIGASIWSFVTYSLLHADLMHIGFNMLWMLPFGSAPRRRPAGRIDLSARRADRMVRFPSRGGMYRTRRTRRRALH
jgi:membrane associated rhomboid family serine protease